MNLPINLDLVLRLYVSNHILCRVMVVWLNPFDGKILEVILVQSANQRFLGFGLLLIGVNVGTYAKEATNTQQ